MTCLVIAEHDQKTLKSSTLSTIAAALACGGDVNVLVVGSEARSVATQAAQAAGVLKVIYIDAPHFKHPLAEDVAEQILHLAPTYTHILAPATAFGKNILPRVAAKLDIAQVSDVCKVVSPDTFERPIYAGNAIATVQAVDAIKVMTVRTTNFEAVTLGAGSASIEDQAPAQSFSKAKFLQEEITQSERPELSAARVIVSGGRALGSAEQFKSVIEPLADKLGAAVGASRAAVDAGYVPNDYQVGQTGKIVAPDLYIAVGISGAIQHIAGMKDSKVIVAINKDPEAPIFGVADYGLVADLFTAIPDLVSELG